MMKALWHSLIAATLGLTMVAGAMAAPVLNVVRTPLPPQIDGRLDEACWQGPAQITEFRCVDKERTLPTQRTEAWVASDADALYVAARCHDDRMDQAQATQTGVDGKVWQDDCLEVFLMPGTPYYYHFAANLLGTRYDARVDTAGKAGPKPETWQGDWRAAAQRGRDAWTMEIAIPFAALSLGPQRLAAPFRFNVGREQRRLAEFSCWPASQFNQWEEFARLEGLGLDGARYGLLLKDAIMGEPTAGPGKFTATVAEEAEPGPLTLRARVQPLPQGEVKTHVAQVASAVGASLELAYEVPLTDGHVALAVDCLDAQGRVRATQLQVFRVPPPVAAALELPLLYQGDGFVTLAGHVALPVALRQRAKLQASLVSGGRPLPAVAVPLADDGAFRATLPLAKLAPGRYAVETRLAVPGLSTEALTSRFPFRLIKGPLD